MMSQEGGWAAAIRPPEVTSLLAQAPSVSQICGEGGGLCATQLQMPALGL
jgi:hypothetical protein